ncbi:MAG: hypothetical protein JXA46_11395 [Dehalococcoidales bacterium]|nr:hypothetical protein [Dehalococcoidales bacterium]
MRKLVIIAAISVLVLLVALFSYNALAQDNSRKEPRSPSTLAPPPTLPVSESLLPEQKPIRSVLVNNEELMTLGMSLPRKLSSLEENSIKTIALNTDTLSQATKQGTPYRYDLVLWMSYNNKNSTWSYLKFSEDQVLKPGTDIVYFPAARIGLGTPQMFQVNIAVDLAGQRAVYAIRTYDKHIAAPSYLSPLTDQEKQKLVEIASLTQIYEQIGDIQVTDFHWVAISSSGGTLCNIEYDVFDKGIPGTIPLQEKSMTIYPAVHIQSSTMAADITIDLNNGKLMDIYSYPVKNTITEK